MAGVQQGAALAVVLVHAVEPRREEASVHHILDDFTGTDEGFIVEGTASAVSRIFKCLWTTDAVHQIHKEHGSGPAVEVGQGEGVDVVGLEYFGYLIQLFQGGRDLQAQPLKDVCAVEDGCANHVVQRHTVDAAVEVHRSQSYVHKVVLEARFLQGILHIPNLTCVHILQQRAAAPAEEDVRLVACTHGDHELGLVFVVDDGYAFDLDARIGGFKALNGMV